MCFFLLIIDEKIVQPNVEAGACSQIIDKCDLINCSSVCKTQDYDGGLVRWKCDEFKLCTCFFNYVPSKHPNQPTRRCEIGLGPCSTATPECNSKCAIKFKGVGTCLDSTILKAKMCICDYNSS